MPVNPQRVLVTGGSGYIAGYCIVQLLEQGYQVRTTVRSLDREAQVRNELGLSTSGQAAESLSFVVADLGSDSGWAEAVADCDFVLHVASPLPMSTPQNEDEVIKPARDGTLRVLRAASQAGVKRVVLTSAFGAVGFGYGRTDHEFTETDWSILDGPGVNAYYKSKTLAERAAWDFVSADANGAKAMELTTVNPVAVLGPLMGSNVSGSNELIRRILAGDLPGYPDFWMPIVDVRDLAKAHLLAMTTPEAAGERFIIGSGTGMTMKQIGLLLKSRLGEQAKRVPTRSIPNFVIRIGAIFNKTMREIVPDLGITKRINVDKSRRVLGLQPRTADEAVLAAAESMLQRGIVK